MMSIVETSMYNTLDKKVQDYLYYNHMYFFLMYIFNFYLALRAVFCLDLLIFCFQRITIT